jgi:hypothetical protein
MPVDQSILNRLAPDLAPAALTAEVCIALHGVSKGEAPWPGLGTPEILLRQFTGQQQTNTEFEILSDESESRPKQCSSLIVPAAPRRQFHADRNAGLLAVIV